jgi:hypothetical protein
MEEVKGLGYVSGSKNILQGEAKQPSSKVELINSNILKAQKAV